jgi:hypothetical protein
MIIYLNRGLILEQEISKALKKYFKDMAIDDLYQQNYSVNVTIEHPFARLLENNGAKLTGLFPACVVTTETDTKPAQLDDVVSTQKIQITKSDVDAIGSMGYLVSSSVIQKLNDAIKERDYLYGIACVIRRCDHVSIEIWAENIQLKNELYELIRLFVAGGMREALATIYKEYCLTIFDKSVRGQRSNNWNFDFGVKLSGAQITFDADYAIEQTVINTELIKIDDPVYVEVIHGEK